MSSPQPSERAALRQADELLKFVSESPKDVPEAISATITEAWEAEQTNQWDAKIAARFWVAYSSLCTLLKPITVDNIIAGRKPLERSPWMFWPPLTASQSLSQRTANRYLWLMMALLALAVGLGFIASVTTTLISENSKLLESATKIVETLDNDVDQLQLAVGDKPFSDPALREQDRKLLKQTLHGFQNYQLLMVQVFKNSATISRFIRIFGVAPYTYEAGSLDYQSIQSLKEGLLIFYQSRAGVTEYQKDAATVTGIITSAILPIVLGTMGACAYVVRMISDQARDMTFSEASPIRHLVRVALGALAGVVIGFGGIFTGTGLSSAALSFIAGYAVEPVFSTLDGIAEKFKRPA